MPAITSKNKEKKAKDSRKKMRMGVKDLGPAIFRQVMKMSTSEWLKCIQRGQDNGRRAKFTTNSGRSHCWDFRRRRHHLRNHHRHSHYRRRCSRQHRN